MRRTQLNSRGLLGALLVGLLVCQPAFAEKPNWGDHNDRNAPKGRNKTQQHNNPKRDRQSEHSSNTNIAIHFNDQHRTFVHDYYTEHYHAGRCPPGLYNKHNGCMPPGQEKRWRKGHPLPHDVIFYDLPPSIVIQLGSPPPHHRYVRVAADILLIAIGTGMVVDAIDDLGNR